VLSWCHSAPWAAPKVACAGHLVRVVWVGLQTLYVSFLIFLSMVWGGHRVSLILIPVTLYHISFLMQWHAALLRVQEKKRHPTPTVIKYPDRTTHPHSCSNHPHIRPILHIAAWVLWQHKIPNFLVWKRNFKDEVIVQDGSWLDSLYFLLIYFLKLCTHVFFFSLI
jgi:hypothetical protein